MLEEELIFGKKTKLETKMAHDIFTENYMEEGAHLMIITPDFTFGEITKFEEGIQ